MTPEEFENLLIAEIAVLDLPALAYPQTPKDYFPQNDPGEVLVRYEGRQPVDRDISGLKSRVKLFAEVVVVTRQLRESNGAYHWLEIIWRHLQGRQLEGMTGQLTMEVESFMDETNGLWQFGQKWSAETDEYQHYSDPYEQNNLGDN